MAHISAKNKSIIIWTIIVFLILLAYLYSLLQHSSKKNRIIKNAAFASGQFTGVIRPFEKGKNGPWYEFEYLVHGNTFKKYEPVFIVNKFGKSIMSHSIPIIYDSTNPADAVILLTDSDFSDFNLKYPDSLRLLLTK